VRDRISLHNEERYNSYLPQNSLMYCGNHVSQKDYNARDV